MRQSRLRRRPLHAPDERLAIDPRQVVPPRLRAEALVLQERLLLEHPRLVLLVRRVLRRARRVLHRPVRVVPVRRLGARRRYRLVEVAPCVLPPRVLAGDHLARAREARVLRPAHLERQAVPVAPLRRNRVEVLRLELLLLRDGPREEVRERLPLGDEPRVLGRPPLPGAPGDDERRREPPQQHVRRRRRLAHVLPELGLDVGVRGLQLPDGRPDAVREGRPRVVREDLLVLRCSRLTAHPAADRRGVLEPPEAVRLRRLPIEREGEVAVVRVARQRVRVVHHRELLKVEHDVALERGLVLDGALAVHPQARVLDALLDLGVREGQPQRDLAVVAPPLVVPRPALHLVERAVRLLRGPERLGARVGLELLDLGELAAVDPAQRVLADPLEPLEVREHELADLLRAVAPLGAHLPHNDLQDLRVDAGALRQFVAGERVGVLHEHRYLRAQAGELLLEDRLGDGADEAREVLGAQARLVVPVGADDDGVLRLGLGVPREALQVVLRPLVLAEVVDVVHVREQRVDRELPGDRQRLLDSAGVPLDLQGGLVGLLVDCGRERPVEEGAGRGARLGPHALVDGRAPAGLELGEEAVPVRQAVRAVRLGGAVHLADLRLRPAVELGVGAEAVGALRALGAPRRHAGAADGLAEKEPLRDPVAIGDVGGLAALAADARREGVLDLVVPRLRGGVVEHLRRPLGRRAVELHGDVHRGVLEEAQRVRAAH